MLHYMKSALSPSSSCLFPFTPPSCSFALYVAQEWQLQHCTRVGSFSTMTACSTSIHTVQYRTDYRVQSIAIQEQYSWATLSTFLPSTPPTLCCCVDVGTSAAQTMLLKSVRQTDRIVQCSAGVRDMQRKEVRDMNSGECKNWNINWIIFAWTNRTTIIIIEIILVICCCCWWCPCPCSQPNQVRINWSQVHEHCERILWGRPQSGARGDLFYYIDLEYWERIQVK